MTPLMYAAYFGHGDLVKELIKGKADPQMLNEDQDKCLHLAARGGFEKIVSFLPLPCLLWSSLSAVKTLLETGTFHVNVEDELNKTTLHKAFESGNLEMFNYLHGKGAEIIQ